jgi:hypothetical protein
MGWKNKVLIVLIVYFAGFATAIYALAPANVQAVGQTVPNPPKSFPHSFLKSDEFATSFNSGMRACIDAGSEAAKYVAQKFPQNKDTPKK